MSGGGVLGRWVAHKSKRDFTNSCTPCLTLKPEVGCMDACCRTLLVPIAQEDLDDGLRPWPPFVDVLERAPTGECAHFEASTGHCLAWERRPLVCRTYDCRDDLRFDTLKRLPGAHVSAPATCHGCGRPLEVLLGVRDLCDGHLPCIHCGAALSVRTVQGGAEGRAENLMELSPATADGATRRRYLFHAFSHRQRWADALPLTDDPREEAIVLAELGRNEEARTLLTPLAVYDSRAVLDLAWVETRLGLDDAARQRIARKLPMLPEALLIRAHLLLANIARRQGEPRSVALHAVLALKRDRAIGGRNAVLKEYVQELLAGGGRADVERAVLTLEGRRPASRLPSIV